jgi:hypothetical protein
VLRWHQQGNMNTTVVLTIHTRAPLDLGNALQDTFYIVTGVSIFINILRMHY